MVFLELRRDSRVMTGNSGCLLCWPRQAQSSIRVAKESCDKPRQYIKKQRYHITFPTKVCIVKAIVFPIVMYGGESWIIKKAER